MNINDVQGMEYPKRPLHYIFQRQAELMEKYQQIEAENGFIWLVGPTPVDLHDKFCQIRLKDTAWRCIEEIGEAIEAVDEKEDTHAKEEIADALHFLVEFTIQAGITPNYILDHGFEHSNNNIYIDIHEFWEDCYRPRSDLEASITDFVRDLGCTCNKLKNKPWKQSQVLTDIDGFHKELMKAWVSFFRVAQTIGITHFNELFDLYFRKSEVNKFRQESNY